jgi:hypothetical protein
MNRHNPGKLLCIALLLCFSGAMLAGLIQTGFRTVKIEDISITIIIFCRRFT